MFTVQKDLLSIDITFDLEGENHVVDFPCG